MNDSVAGRRVLIVIILVILVVVIIIIMIIVAAAVVIVVVIAIGSVASSARFGDSCGGLSLLLLLLLLLLLRVCVGFGDRCGRRRCCHYRIAQLGLGISSCCRKIILMFEVKHIYLVVRIGTLRLILLLFRMMIRVLTRIEMKRRILGYHFGRPSVAEQVGFCIWHHQCEY